MNLDDMMPSELVTELFEKGFTLVLTKKDNICGGTYFRIKDKNSNMMSVGQLGDTTIRLVYQHKGINSLIDLFN